MKYGFPVWVCLALALAGCGPEKPADRAAPAEAGADTGYADLLESPGRVKIRKRDPNGCLFAMEQEYTRYFLDQDTLLSATFRYGESCLNGKQDARVRIRAFALLADLKISRQPIWEIEDSGARVDRIFPDFIGITQEGCCAMRDNAKYYSRSSGRYIGRGDVAPLNLGFRNPERILIAQTRHATGTTVRHNGLKFYLGDRSGNLDSLTLDSGNVPAFGTREVMGVKRMHVLEPREKRQVRVDAFTYGNGDSLVSLILSADDRLDLLSVSTAASREE